MNICMDIIKKEKYYKAIVLLLSFATVCGITLNLDIATGKGSWFIKYLRSMGGFSMNKLILFAGICMLYHYAFSYLKQTSFSLRDGIWAAVIGFFFANFMVWGYSFEQTESYQLVLCSEVQMLKSFTMAVAYFILFTVGIVCLYRFLYDVNINARDIGDAPKNIYVRLFCKHPFLTPFVTMLICYIPYIVLSYPGIFTGDAWRMICQGYNFPPGAYKGLILLDENVFMTGQHAVVYPVFLHIFLRLSKAVFDNYNYGVFAVAMIQLLAILAVVSCTLKYMLKQKIHFAIILSTMIYYIISPRVQNYMFLITKDVLSGCALLIFLVTAYKLLQDKEARSRKSFVWLWLSACGVGLLRNDGKIVIFLSLVTMILFMGKDLRKQLLLVTVGCMMVVLSFTRIIMPALHITPVSSRVLFSIPFQQTARYVRDYGDEVTEEEKEAIDAILPYDKLAQCYRPQRSDGVKNKYKIGCSKDDMRRYFKVWLQMFCKHPGVYFEATMNNYFYYVYPGKKPANKYSYEQSLNIMETEINTDEYLATIDMEIRHPYALERARGILEKLRESIFALPVLSMFRCPAMFVWVFVLLVCYLLNKKRWKVSALMSPIFFSLLVCFASPCNGDYFRYLYGVTLCLPIAVVLGIMGDRNI